MKSDHKQTDPLGGYARMTVRCADVLNLYHIRELGAPIASIGGAGISDGVFLTGIIAVLLA